MLLSLTVNNLALIEELEMDFTKGLNVLTGETGAGKSILIGSVNLALGAPADASLIRDGKDHALIELTFRTDDPETLSRLKEMDLSPEEDGTVVLQRKIMPGRSVCKVQGETVTVKQLRALAPFLIQIHGQNDQQQLLSAEEQLRLLDRYAGDEALKIKEQVRTGLEAYRALEAELEKTNLDERERQREADLIRYELAEIEAASLKEQEDEQLEEAFRKMESGRKSSDALSGAVSVLDADAEGGALGAISEALRLLAPLKGDSDAAVFYEQLADAENLVRDLTREMRRRLDDGSFSEEAYAEVTDRLNVINRLKDKYASSNGSVTDILDYAEEQTKRLQQLEDLDAYRERLARDAGAAHEAVLQHARALSTLRKTCAKRFEKALKEALSDFDFADLQFAIDVQADENALTREGMDRVTFLISTNTGEKLRKLSDVASGGELSRVMLGIRTVLAAKNDAASMIFDEIDAGISGKTAWSVAKKLGQLSGNRQVLCITHLSQIAAMYDTHFLIYKDVSGDRTFTRIRQLEEADSTKELARLVGTAEVSEAAMENAAQIRKEACAFKAQQKEHV